MKQSDWADDTFSEESRYFWISAFLSVPCICSASHVLCFGKIGFNKEVMTYTKMKLFNFFVFPQIKSKIYPPRFMMTIKNSRIFNKCT